MNNKALIRIIGLAILVVGAVLVGMGFQSTETLGEEVRQELTGEYSDRTQWYIIGGIAAIVVGGGLALLAGRLTPRA